VSYQKRYWLEKFQVQAAGAASLLLAYFLLAPLLEGPDPEGPLTFLPLGGAARGLVFAGCLLLLAGLCSAVTVSSRPSGPLAASLLGAAGVALRSGPIRTLFWQRPEALPEVYFEMILELLAFGVVVILAAAVVGLVRWGWLRVRPGWMWQPWRTSVAEPASGSGLAGIDPTGLLRGLERRTPPDGARGSGRQPVRCGAGIGPGAGPEPLADAICPAPSDCLCPGGQFRPGRDHRRPSFTDPVRVSAPADADRSRRGHVRAGLGQFHRPPASGLDTGAVLRPSAAHGLGYGRLRRSDAGLLGRQTIQRRQERR